MAEYQWTPGADVVNVFIPVGIPNVRSVSANDEWGISAPKCAIRVRE